MLSHIERSKAQSDFVSHNRLWWSQHLLCSTLDEFSMASIAVIGSTPAVFLLQGPEDSMQALPDGVSPMCFGECVWHMFLIKEGESRPKVGHGSAHTDECKHC